MDKSGSRNLENINVLKILTVTHPAITEVFHFISENVTIYRTTYISVLRKLFVIKTKLLEFAWLIMMIVVNCIC